VKKINTMIYFCYLKWQTVCGILETSINIYNKKKVRHITACYLFNKNMSNLKLKNNNLLKET